MESNPLQNVLYLVIIIIVSAIFFMIEPVHNKVVHGVLLPSAAPMTAIKADQVKAYQGMPNGSVTQMGLINTSKHFNSRSEDAQKANFKASVLFAKQQAAKIGANGIVYGFAASERAISPLDTFSSQWLAIHVETKKKTDTGTKPQ